MKKILFLLSGALLLANLFVSTGCEDDTVVDPIGPSAFIDTHPDSTYVPGEEITFTISATAGDSDLKSVTITEDFATIDINRVVDVNNQGVGNAVNSVVVDSDKTGLTWDITIVSQSTLGTVTYGVIVEDENGLTSEATFDFAVKEEPIINDLEGDLSGVLLNSAGPTGTGGLDLDDGIGTGSSDPTAEIRDEGVDIGAPDPATNWKRQISGVNGSQLKYVDLATNPELPTEYDDIITKADIQKAWDGGTSFTVSNALMVGDIIAVENGGRIYLLRVDNMFEDTTVMTMTSNDDGYEFSIKY